MTTEKVLPAVSIIIPALNEEKYLPVLLESLSRVTSPLDIIVVDGQSADATVSVVESFETRFQLPSSLRVISSIRGLSAQRNNGVAMAKNETLLFLDADVVIPSEEKFELLISSFRDSSSVVGVARLTPLERSLKGIIMFGFFDTVQKLFLLFGKPYLGTFCMITTKSLFAAIGGFDESKPVTEDIDFCFRASQKGHVTHLPVRIPTSARRFIKYGYWFVFWQYIREGAIFITTGKARINKIHYPFGEY